MAIAENCRGLVQLIAGPCTRRARYLQRPVHELISFTRQFSGRRSVRRPIGQGRFHLPPVFGQGRVDALVILGGNHLPQAGDRFLA